MKGFAICWLLYPNLLCSCTLLSESDERDGEVPVDLDALELDVRDDVGDDEAEDVLLVELDVEGELGGEVVDSQHELAAVVDRHLRLADRGVLRMKKGQQSTTFQLSGLRSSLSCEYSSYDSKSGKALKLKFTVTFSRNL